MARKAKRELVNTTIEAGGAVVGAGIGMALGGPVGAYIGAGAGPVVAYSAKAAKESAEGFWTELNKRLHRAKMTERSFVETLQAQDHRRFAFYKVINAALQELDPSRIRFFAQAASELRSADARKSASIALIASMLADLTPLHIEVLSFIHKRFASRGKEPGVTPDELIDEFPNEENILRSVVRVLELHGLIVDNARFDQRSGGVYWEASDAGVWLLDLWRTTSTRGAVV